MPGYKGALDSFSDVVNGHSGKVVDKWTGYFPLYDSAFYDLRFQPVRILEIGIQNGGSLEVWAKYFPSATAIVGVDIDEKCGSLRFADERIQVLVADAASTETKLHLQRLHQQFDIIIDDGSHRSSDIIKSLANLLPLLSDRGVYLVEDLHCSYFADFEGGTQDPFSSLALLRRLTDYPNFEFWGNDQAALQVVAYWQNYWSVQFDVTALRRIESVEFFNSMCVIRTSGYLATRLGHRLVRGSEQLVDTGALQRNGDGAATLQGMVQRLDSDAIGIEDRAYQFDEKSRVALEERKKSQSLARQLAATALELTNSSQKSESLVRQLAATALELTNSRQKSESLARQLAASTSELGNLRISTTAKLTKANDRSRELLAASSAALSEVSRLSSDLASLSATTTRLVKRPGRVLLDFLAFHALNATLKLDGMLTAKAAERFRASAAKRDPDRFGQPSSTPPASPIATSDALQVIDEVPVDPWAPRRVQFSNIDEGFVPYEAKPEIRPSVKLIAFYLPQFHPFPENDLWWGKGFTEWSNVGKALPNYEGHYQPHCPIHLGYYDLRVPSVMEEQARMAREYGLHGFSFYLYWFSGKILMHEPIEAMLHNQRIDIPFCFTWANENWTRRWDGAEDQVLISQNYSMDDSIALIRYLAAYFADARYIRIGNRPVFVVYRVNIIPDIAKVASAWREEAVRLGFDGLYLVAAQSFGIGDPREFGFDAAVEFPPHGLKLRTITEQFPPTNPSFEGSIYDYREMANLSVAREEPEYPLFRATTLSWDNTARRQDNGYTFENFSVTAYAQWLEALCHRVQADDKYPEEEKFVFINAWNEWAEGTHLEPDRKHGFGYLAATYECSSRFDLQKQLHGVTFPTRKRSEMAVVLHMHYAEVWPEVQAALKRLRLHDLFVTTTTESLARKILNERPDAFVEIVENRGRDIRPFLSILRRLRKLDYECVLKIHSKRTLYRSDGDTIRAGLFAALFDDRLADEFAADRSLGLIVPRDFLLDWSEDNSKSNLENIAQVCAELGRNVEWKSFPAGSMYWFRPAALELLDRIELNAGWHLEEGLSDGTKAHAVERLISAIAQDAGFSVNVTGTPMT